MYQLVLLSHTSRVPGLIWSSGHYVCGISVHSFHAYVGFLWVLWYPFTVQKQPVRWTGCPNVLLGWKVHVHGAMWWTGVVFSLTSRLINEWITIRFPLKQIQ